MNNNRKIARKHTDNKENIRVHKVIEERHVGKRNFMNWIEDIKENKK